MRIHMIEHTHHDLGVRKKCHLLDVNRSRTYYKKKTPNKQDVEMMNEMRDIYYKYPFYGYRKMQVVLARNGYLANHKKVQRLMALAGLKAVYPKQKTTIRNKQHKTYPYLLSHKNISDPNVAWGVDITYIKMRHGFIYLVCMIDIFSRRIMGWSTSVTLDAQFCVKALDEALLKAKPEIVNSDQGCQFTGSHWIKKLTQEEVQISMDGKGRWADNIYIERFWRSLKYENTFLQSFDSVMQAKKAIGEYIQFYNYERPHQALNYKTPDYVYQTNKVMGIKRDSVTTNMLRKHKIKDSKKETFFWS